MSDPEPLFDEFPSTPTAAWEEKISEDLRERDLEEVLNWESIEGITLRAIYRSEDLESLDHPTDGPLTAKGDGQTAQAWRIRQDIYTPELGAAQSHIEKALSSGVTDLGLAALVHNSTLHGLPLQTSGDLRSLLQDVDICETPLHLRGGRAAPILLGMLYDAAKTLGTSPDALSGSTDFDPVAALLENQGFPPESSFALGASLLRSEAIPSTFTPLAVDLRPYHDAGGSAVQTLAAGLGALSEQLAHYADRGISVDDAVDKLHAIVPVGTSYFLEIAKLRALRTLLPQVIGAYDEHASANLPLHAVTSRRMMTVYDPHMNMLRTSTAAMAATLAGCDMLTVRPHTAAFAAPNDFAYRIARNTQLILREESKLDLVADPAAGAYYIEQATDRLAREAWSLFQDIEANGGIVSSLRDRTLHDAIAETRTERQRAVATRDHVIVGTNHYPQLEETRLEDVQTRPTGTDLTSANSPELENVSFTAIRKALDEGATLGDVLHALSNPTSEIDPLPSLRLSEPFERVRLRTEQHAQANGSAPSVVLLPMGNPSMRSARANFTRNLLGCAGFTIHKHLRFDAVREAVKATLEVNADIAVLCSSDEEYLELAPDFCEALRSTDADPLVVVAGHPDESDALREAGVDAFIHKEASALETLEWFQSKLDLA